MKKSTNRDVTAYFEDSVIPLIAEEYPDVAADMSIRVDGAFGLGIADESSNLDSTMYLEDRLWAAKGGQVQLLLETALEERLVDKTDKGCHCVGIWVHPLSWLRERRRFLETRAEAGTDLPWEEVPIEQFHEMQENLVVRDPRGIFRHLKRATTPERHPRWLWDKRLIVDLREALDDLDECRRTLKRGDAVGANIMLGSILEDLIHLAFVINRRYYPWRPHLRWAFEQLPAPATDALPRIDGFVSSADPESKLAMLEEIGRLYVDHIAAHDILPTLNLASPQMGFGDLGAQGELHQELLWAERCKAWSSPKWRDWVTNCQKMAGEDGYPEHWWIWSLWDLKRKTSHI